MQVNVDQPRNYQQETSFGDGIIQWTANITIVVSLMFATFTKSFAALKPSEISLLVLVALIVIKRIINKDFSFSVTKIDAAFLLLILGGAILPFMALEIRSMYITKDILRNLIAPIFYYVWYRAFLEATPSFMRAKVALRILFITLLIVCTIGILQFLHIHAVDSLLLQYYQVDPFLLRTVHRAQSVIGDWEVIGALSTYPLILMAQFVISNVHEQMLGKYWKPALIVMTAVFLASLLVSFSVGGVVALISGIITLIFLNPNLRKISTKYLVTIGIAVIAVSGFIVYKKLIGSSHALAIPVTWLFRLQNWQIVYAATTSKISTTIFGVQPAPAYPVSTLDSADNMYVLYFYRGGAILVGAYIGFIVFITSALIHFQKRLENPEKSIILATASIFVSNSILGMFDPHFSYAAESHTVLTLLAISVGLVLQYEKQYSIQSVHHKRNIAHYPIARASVLLGTFATVLTVGASWSYNKTLPKPPTPLSVQLFPTNSAISSENSLIGTFNWQLDAGVDTTFIQGYAGVVSIDHGQNLPLYISSRKPVSYALQVYRIGWYRGWGGRLITTISDLQSTDQGYWTAQDGLQSCLTCQIDPATHLIDAHWQQSYDLQSSTQWVSGVYLIKIAATYDGRLAESYIPFIVRNDQDKKGFLVNIPVDTWQASNGWGGYSLFGQDGASPYVTQTDRAYAVSYNRPYNRSAGAGEFLNYDIHLIRWLERSNYDITYSTDVDISQFPQTMLDYSGIITSSRDPFWTASYYNGVLQALQKNVYMLYFGAQNGDWQSRYAPDSNGVAGRTLISYQVSSHAQHIADELQRDPFFTIDPRLVTARWSDPFLHATQLPFKLPVEGYLSPTSPNPPLVIANDPNISQIVTLNTGLVPGMSVLDGIIGPNYDGVSDSSAIPNGYQVFAQATVPNSSGGTTYAIIGAYYSSIGTVVFNAGTMRYVWSLDDFTAPYADEPNTIQGNQHLSDMTSNVLRVACHCGN